MIKNRKVLIVGGGIAGPALAIKLIEKGAIVKVIEARKETEMNEGLFMGVSPNGLNILSELIDINQIYDEYAPGTLHFFNSGGKKIAELDTDYQLAKYGIKSVTLKRSGINKLLHAKLEELGCPVEYDRKLHSICISGKKVSVETSKSNFNDFDILVGADGIHSTCRNLLFPEQPKPAYTKLLSTGAIVKIPNWTDKSNAIKMTFGERAFFGFATSTKRHVWWFNNFYLEKEPDRQAMNMGLKQEIKNELLELHKNDHKLIREILLATKDIFAYPVYDMPAMKKWYGSNFCLIGDAAHAISPHTGQGASLALEDSSVLAAYLDNYSDVELAFAEFQKIRQPRVEKIIAQARKVGNSKSKANPIAIFFRDIFLKKFINLEKKKMDWVYSYDISKLKIMNH